MNPGLLLLTSIAVLIVLRFLGFVGCAAILGVDDVSYATTPDGKPDYPATIKKETSLVAYWRLGELASTPVPSSGGQAKSETGFHNGDYDKLPLATTADTVHHSPPTAGTLTLGVTPGLLELDPTSPCIRTDGGFIQVPFDDALNPPQFTLEGWVKPDIGNDLPGNYYCLVESSGPPGPLGATKKTGFGLYLGPKDVPPANPPGLHFWQIWMGDGSKFSQAAVSKNPVKFKQLTYLVLSFDGNNLQLFLYYPDTNQNLDQISGELKASIGNFKRNDTSNLGTGNFFIGTGSNLYSGPSIPKQRLYPFKGQLQEVALYNVDLTAPNNQGLGKLAGHFLAGGKV